MLAISFWILKMQLKKSEVSQYKGAHNYSLSIFRSPYGIYDV